MHRCSDAAMQHEWRDATVWGVEGEAAALSLLEEADERLDDVGEDVAQKRRL